MASDMFDEAPENRDAFEEAETLEDAAPEDVVICTECGASETGFFCRQCGTLLRGGEMVLCPRCHRVVPGGDYCNQCGQSLVGLALNLRQLALAGDEFMLTSAPAPASPAPARAPAPVPLPLEYSDTRDSLSFFPDESIKLEDADLPDWLEELPKTRAPREVRERIYPTLRPVESREPTASQGRYLVAVVILLALTLVGIVGFVLLLLAQAI